MLTVHFVTDRVVGATYCVGPSMEPTFKKEGTIAIIWKFPYRFLQSEYEKGDVVIAISPTDPNKKICKRITALPKEAAVVRGFLGRKELIQIPAGMVWLAGDNPDNSTDSRYYGPVPIGLIQGKLICKFESPFPFLHPIPEDPYTRSLKDKERVKEEVFKKQQQDEEELTTIVERTIELMDSKGNAQEIEIKRLEEEHSLPRQKGSKNDKSGMSGDSSSSQ